jgi:hypothetical protein
VNVSPHTTSRLNPLETLAVLTFASFNRWRTYESGSRHICRHIDTSIAMPDCYKNPLLIIAIPSEITIASAWYWCQRAPPLSSITRASSRS